MSMADDRAERPPSGNGEPPYRWLDEWLCEYVDGAMDPSLETMFEQYVEANPELKAHIERLRETRALLRDHSLADSSPPDTTPDRSTGSEAAPSATGGSSTDTGALAASGSLGVASSVVLALIVGFLAGTIVVDAPGTSIPPQQSPSMTLERRALQSPLVPASKHVFSPSDTLSAPSAFPPQRP